MSTWTELTCYSLFSLNRLPAWDTLLRAHTHDVGMQNMQPHARLAEPHTQLLTRLAVVLVALSHGDPPVLLDPARHPAIISIRPRPAGTSSGVRLGVDGGWVRTV